MNNRFWETKNYTDFTEEEWESICMNCGKCCLFKLQDEDTDEIYYTRVVCKYFDKETGKCREYANRCTLVPECLKLNKDNLNTISWIPKTCAYRLIREGKPLPSWHPLISGKKIGEEHSIKNRCICETQVKEEDLEDYIDDWDEL